MPVSSAHDLVHALASSLGLHEAAIAEDGGCGLVFDDSKVLTLEADPTRPAILHLHTVVGTVPEAERRSFYRRLLAGNFLGRGTGGAVLCLNDQDEVLLQSQVDTTVMNGELFAAHVEGFLKAARCWSDRLAGHADAGLLIDPLHTHLLRI